MEVKIETTKENKLFDRKEIEATVHFAAATPNRKDIKSSICGKIGANPDFTVLRSVKNEFGLKRVKVSAHVYSNIEALKRNEPKHIQVRESVIPKEEKKKEVAKAVKKEAKVK